MAELAKRPVAPDQMPEQVAEHGHRSAEEATVSRPSPRIAMVPAAGLEPAHPKVRDFKSLASTCSAKRAHPGR